MIGSLCRCKKSFLLLLVVIGVLVYTFINKDYFNPSGIGPLKTLDNSKDPDSPTDHSNAKREAATALVKTAQDSELVEQNGGKQNNALHDDSHEITGPEQNNEHLASRMNEDQPINSLRTIPGPKQNNENSASLKNEDKLLESPNTQKPEQSDENKTQEIEDQPHIIPGRENSHPGNENPAISNNGYHSMNSSEHLIPGPHHKPTTSDTLNPQQAFTQINQSIYKNTQDENQYKTTEQRAEKEGNAKDESIVDDNEVSVDQEGEEGKEQWVGVLQRLLNDKPRSKPHPYSICPFLGLRKHSANDSIDVKCKVKDTDETSCKLAYVAYNNDETADQCYDQHGGNTTICRYKDNEIRCDMSVCKDKYVYLFGVDTHYGIVKSRDSKTYVNSNRKLERILHQFSKHLIKNGLNFCFLKCRSKNNVKTHVEQLIMFPQNIGQSQDNDESLFNINIILLDSVSRPHFYRSMHKSVAALRNIANDHKIQATVLDYELFQSMADFTFHNIRAFMSGKTDFSYKEHKEQHYGIEVLFKQMKSKGYYTVLQEDSCWYDEWGSLFTDNVFQGKKPENLKEFKIRWKKFKKKLRTYYIDDYGLSHFSCEALERYNITNQFNQPKKICFAGKVFAEYFLSYNEQLFNQSMDTPIFSYTHLNTGHEVSGTRIKQIDHKLSEYFRTMAYKQNTLTMVFSDHGPKTTRYAFRTMSGRAEIYDPLMFVILPEGVASKLGYQRTKALIENQKRLFTAHDLHNTLMSIGEPNRENTGSNRLEGIFAEIAPNRTCTDLITKSSAICKCKGWDEFFEVNHPPFIWLAELALGTLNNRIQNEYMTGMLRQGGFGKCQRLIGRRFEKIRRRSVGNMYQVTMDLIVNPEDEIFEVQVEYPINSIQRIESQVLVTHLSRISIYRRFETCKDENVDIKDCVCKSHKTSSRYRWVAMDNRKNLLRILTRSENFGSKLKFNDLHASCLIMVTRTHSSRISVFEIANACTDRAYRVKVTGKSRGKAFISTSFPISLRLEPLTVHFLFSVYNLEKPYGFKATTSYKAYFV